MKNLKIKTNETSITGINTGLRTIRWIVLFILLFQNFVFAQTTSVNNVVNTDNPVKASFQLPAPRSDLKFWWTGICEAESFEIDEYEEWANSVMPEGSSSFGVDIASTYLGWDGFNTMADMKGDYIEKSLKFKGICLGQPADVTIVLAMGQVAKDISNSGGKRPETWTEIANGDYDAYYQDFFNALKDVMDGTYTAWGTIPDRRVEGDKPYSRLILRLNWEWNRPKNGFNHVANGNIEKFKEGTEHFMQIGRVIMPGIRFDCHPSRARYIENDTYYKLSEAVNIDDWDFIGMALHENTGSHGENDINTGAIGYNADSPDVFDEDDWNVILYGSSGQQGEETGTNWGIDDAARLARENDKGFTMPEWSPQQVWKNARGPSYKGGRGFVEHMWDYCYQNKDVLCYEAGFDSSQGKMYPEGASSDDGFPWLWPTVIRERWLNFDNRQQITTGSPSVTVSNLSVYPNPVERMLYVRNTNQYSMIRILDMSGVIKLSFELSGDNNNVDLSSLSPGVYIVELTGNSVSYKKKIIKH